MSVDASSVMGGMHLEATSLEEVFFCRGEKERKIVVGRGKEERGCVTPVFWVILWLKRCGFV